MGSDAFTHPHPGSSLVGEGTPLSHIARLTSHVHLVIRAILALGVSAGEVGGQDIGPVSFRDSLVMRQVAYRAPCPNPVPKSWTLVDSTLGSGLRCSLVEAGVWAIELQLQQRPALRQRADPRNPLCVRVYVANNMGSTGLPGDWMVVFELAPDLPAYVLIDRQTGSVAAVAVGRSEPEAQMPSCQERSFVTA